MKPIELTRAPLRRKRGNDGCRINVTAKVEHMFSPHPTWVRELKTGEIDEALYREAYEEMLDEYRREIPGWIQGIRDAGITRITLLCFCGDGKFCHTHILIDRLLHNYPDTFTDARRPEQLPIGDRINKRMKGLVNGG